MATGSNIIPPLPPPGWDAGPLQSTSALCSLVPWYLYVWVEWVERKDMGKVS